VEADESLQVKVIFFFTEDNEHACILKIFRRERAGAVFAFAVVTMPNLYHR
jgi:hypothetical protein